MFDGMSKKMDKTIDKIKKNKTINEENLSEIIKELKITLLDADVNLKVVKSFLFQVSQKAKGQMIEQGKTASQEVIKIVLEELTNILGKQTKDLKLSTKKGVLMMVGLQGSGKTTSVGKIAKLLFEKKKTHKKPLLVACDVYRPAAIDQLETLAKQLKVEIFLDRKEKDVTKIAKAAMAQADKNDNDLIIFDTAGRLHIDKALMKELVDLKKVVKPEEILLTVDAMSGQDIITVAKEFNDTLSLTGAIITKLDSDTRAGASLSIASLIGLPIKLIGTGEKLQDIETFHPNRIASRILGLGDVESLIEKAKEVTDESKNEKMFRRMMAGKYDLVDLMDSLEEVSKMGNMGAIAKMMPGMNKMMPDTDKMDKDLKIYKVIISSMTRKEKRNPKLLNHPKRKTRILKGCGKTQQEYNLLLRQFEKSKKQMEQVAKMMKSGKMPNMKNMMGGGGGNPFGK